MLNSRSVSAELWVNAHKCLVLYFARRRCLNAEDLAQETLMTVWRREDFVFEKPEDFLKVCYGFARHILQENNRDGQKHAADELAADVASTPLKVQGMQLQELQVFIDEVRVHAKAELLAEELALIVEALKRDGCNPPLSSQLRVKLHRARKKLGKITGWRK